jgi:TPR repeat protein
MSEAQVLSALQSLAGESCALSPQDWPAVASEALAGSASAQYIVATAFEKTGDPLRAEDWYLRSARQGYSPAASKLLPSRHGSVA